MPHDIEDNGDLGWSVKQTAAKTSESRWVVVNVHLREGHYEAVKRGRRTIILPPSVRKYWATLPKAKFAPPLQRKSAATPESFAK